MTERGRTLLERIVAFSGQGPEPVVTRGAEIPPPVVVTGDGSVDLELGLRRLPPDPPARFRLEATAGDEEREVPP